MLDKTYRPTDIETPIYARWEESGAFDCGRRPGAQPFSIVIPPPNVTGSLHIGHALNNTLQDILARFERMRGRDVLWQPGTDHAGIATQMVVERRLEAAGTKRADLGREAFLERVWQWKAESGGTILRQLRRLGASCDWRRERFTMDDGLSKAVLHVFVTLYEQGLIYKDKRLVNWDPKLLTAISDLEVQQRETKGFLWHIRYPVEGLQDTYITVATTRPETMLGDVAVAVHPDDPRYTDLIGRNAILPLVGRPIPIIADLHADPEQGSGAVKITPAHDFNDFEVGKRHGLPQINILDANAHINDEAPERFRGLDRYAAREKILAELEEAGLLEKAEDHVNMLPHGDRSGVVIEPWLTDQWYVDAPKLARRAIEAVERGETTFVPRNWDKTYFEWMRNIEPWCISRQLWWGHQIPAWYAPDGKVFVAESEAAASAQAERHYGAPTALTRDPDVLDTWFSSGLWPFSTLGWPDKTPELDRFYPTSVLVTGFDIIFFWVARMMMLGLHFLHEVPFRTVYIHALVRDAQGQKMSKSKGNVVDPLELMDTYGADALRFTLAALAAQGRDVKLSTARIEGYRNFITKLWNAARFCDMNECRPDPAFDPAACRETVNRWMVGEVARTAAQVTDALEAFRFNDAANILYHAVWHVFCDWYVELIKPQLQDAQGSAAQAETRAAAAWVLDRLLVLLHPFTPFVTEALWQRVGQGRDQADNMLVVAPWVAPDAIPQDREADAEMDWLVRLVGAVRSVRAEMGVPAAAKIVLRLKDAGAETRARLDRHRDLICRLARLSEATPTDDAWAPDGSVQMVLDEATLILPLADVIDLAQERARLARELDKLTKEIAQIDARLGNPGFVAKAPEDVIDEHRERKEEAERARAKLDEALSRLQGAA